MCLEVSLKKKLNGFSLDVEWETGNKLAVLFGFSGAGKTMTLQMIAGLVNPDKGVVRLNGRTLFDSERGIALPPHQRSFGYVFQDLALFPHMTVMKNILYGAKNIPVPERSSRAKEVIRTFHLDGLEDRLPSEISGGQKQRVAFARALIRRPDVLMLDEPFSALDLPLRLEMRNVLMEIRRTFRIPIILVTHDVTEAYTMADRVIVYSHGRIAQTGAPFEVFHRPASPEVGELCNPAGGFITAAAAGR